MWKLWLTALIGVWVLISPWVYNFSSNTGALWNSIIFGAIIIILSTWAAISGNNKA